MKKFLLFVIVCAAFTFSTNAQECAVCGDWQGVYTEEGVGNVKIIIRVKQNGNDGDYIVRLKRIYPNGKVEYENFEEYTINVSKNDPNLLWWQKKLREDDTPGTFRKAMRYMDTEEIVYDNSAYYDRTEIYKRYNIKVTGNKMVHEDWVGYDRMHHIDSPPGEYFRTGTENFSIKTYVLYKDDSDW